MKFFLVELFQIWTEEFEYFQKICLISGHTAYANIKNIGKVANLALRALEVYVTPILDRAEKEKKQPLSIFRKTFDHNIKIQAHRQG